MHSQFSRGMENESVLYKKYEYWGAGSCVINTQVHLVLIKT